MSNILRGVALKVLLPILMLIAAFMPSRKERLQAFVISINNKLILSAKLRTKKILLLLPHCLQVDKCDIRITLNARNCKRCGKCKMKNLIELADSHEMELFVATGGNLARRIVGDVRPEAIVAVACERDLSTGIADVFPMPVYGISNERPNGPCFNTTVDLSKVEEAIALLAG